jgi:hypothetical protein
MSAVGPLRISSCLSNAVSKKCSVEDALVKDDTITAALARTKAFVWYGSGNRWYRNRTVSL